MSVWLHLPYVWMWTIFICLMYGCELVCYYVLVYLDSIM
jgi:hypothetical protein